MEDLAVRCNVPDINWHITLDGHRHVLTRLPGLGGNPSRRFVFFGWIMRFHLQLNNSGQATKNGLPPFNEKGQTPNLWHTILLDSYATIRAVHHLPSGFVVSGRLWHTRRGLSVADAR